LTPNINIIIFAALMAKKKEKISVKRKVKKEFDLYLTTKNYLIFGAAVLVLILGYFFLSKGPADSFWSLTLAPIVLLIGYCVLVPIAILLKPGSSKAKK